MSGVVVIEKPSVLVVRRSGKVISSGVRVVQNVYPAGAAFEHTQATPASEWTVNHNLGYRPAIELWDEGGNEIDAQVLHLSVNQARIYFNAPVAGSARCN